METRHDAVFLSLRLTRYARSIDQVAVLCLVLLGVVSAVSRWDIGTADAETQRQRREELYYFGSESKPSDAKVSLVAELRSKVDNDDGFAQAYSQNSELRLIGDCESMRHSYSRNTM
jgi:hypothetical protein